MPVLHFRISKVCAVLCFFYCFFFYYSLYFSFHFALFAVADEIQRLSNVQLYSAFHAFDGVLSRSKSLQASFCTFFFSFLEIWYVVQYNKLASALTS